MKSQMQTGRISARRARKQFVCGFMKYYFVTVIYQGRSDVTPIPSAAQY
jgi:hypothetical protein